jgi:hypothetical protein
VLLTAFTHSAIDNLLARISSLAAQLNASVPRAKLVAALGDASSASAEVQALTQKDCSRWLDTNAVCVLGATVWALSKSDTFGVGEVADSPFSLVVIDEASQLPVSHGALAVRFVDRHSGRLWVAGDHLQLAPLTHVQLPALRSSATTDVVPLLHRSLLECVLRTADGAPCTLGPSARGAELSPCALKLQDNWRMVQYTSHPSLSVLWSLHLLVGSALRTLNWASSRKRCTVRIIKLSPLTNRCPFLPQLFLSTSKVRLWPLRRCAVAFCMLISVGAQLCVALLFACSDSAERASHRIRFAARRCAVCAASEPCSCGL